MNTSVSIRRCTPGDLPALVLHEPPGANIAAGFLERQAAGDLVYATAWTENTPHGGAVLDFRAGPAPELKHLFVYPGSRGMGAGRALCLWLEGEARLAGHSRITLGVEPGNSAALSLYESLGYRPTGDTSAYSHEFLDPAGRRSVATETADTYSKPLGPPSAVEASAAPETTAPEPAPAAPSRVLFYGVTGSGKSTAARAYARATGLPEFSADDDIGWLPGWQQRTVVDQRDIAAGIAARDSWVLDSAYGVWRDVVLPRAELVIGLDYPRWLSLARLVRRSLRRPLTREPVCNGNRETVARLFVQDSIIRWHFRSFARKRAVMRSLQADPGMPATILFRRPRELDAWLAQLPPRPRGPKASESTTERGYAGGMAGLKAPRELRKAERASLLRAVKAFHTFAWFTIEACMVYVLYAGARGRTDRRVGLAAGVVTAETLVFAANGFHCPLTAVAKDLGDEAGSVTDIYLPRWFAKNLPGIHVPLILAAVLLHWRNHRAAGRQTGG